MKQGSIVVMITELGAKEKEILLENKIYEWPTPSDTPLEVTELVKWNGLVSGVGVALDLYPNLSRNKVYLDIVLFREVQPPEEVNISQVIGFQQPS